MNIYSHTLDHLWKTFLSYFTTLEAAGGLVQNSDRSILFIKRNNRWDIPKGHIEKGESPEECAIREVTEECGISPDGIIYQLKNSYHIYQYHDYYCLKTTYWFFMNYSGKQTPIPQESEGITEAVWIGKESLKEVIAGTWLSLIDVINEVRLKFLQ